MKFRRFLFALSALFVTPLVRAADPRNFPPTCSISDDDSNGPPYASTAVPAPTPTCWSALLVGSVRDVEDAVIADLDGGGDLDAITTEEVRNLGVTWYENSLRHPSPSR